jgi:hypothetical protein
MTISLEMSVRKLVALTAHRLRGIRRRRLATDGGGAVPGDAIAEAVSRIPGRTTIGARRRYNPAVRSRLAVWILIASALGASGCAYSMIRDGRIRQEPFDEIVSRTAAARGLEPPLPIDARVVTAAELDGVVRRAIAREWTDDQFRRYQRALTVMGLWPADRDLIGEVTAVMREEIAGLYDPGDRALYLVSDAKAPFQTRLMSLLLRRDVSREFVLSHELVHLLQHARYPSLMDTDPFFHEHDDAGSAVQAAIEGDAVRYGFEALGLLSKLPAPEDFRRELDSELASVHDGALAAAPALIRLTLAFPYTDGYRLSYGEGKALLDSPPASTEQVLHPGERRAAFLAIDLRPLRDALPEQCRFVHENTLGELEISVLFRDLAAEPSEDAWAGWDGDRYLVAECDDGPAILWLTAWDSRSDALEFETAYRGILAALVARAGFAAPPKVTRSKREVVVYSDALAPLVRRLSERARRQRVSTLPELRDHFGAGVSDRELERTESRGLDDSCGRGDWSPITRRE